MSEHWKHFVEQHQHLIPFICAAGGRVGLDWNAIIQALIIAVVTAVGTTQIMTVRLDERTTALKEALTRIETKLGRVEDDQTKVKERMTVVEVQQQNGVLGDRRPR